MRHADDHFLDTLSATLLDQIIEHRNQAIATLEREAFLTDILGMQVALHPLGSGQLPEDVLLLVSAEMTLHARELEVVLQPEPLLGVRHMREFGTNRVGVDEFQVAQDVAQRGPFGDRLVSAAGEELRIQILIRQAEILEVQDEGLGALLHAQWIELGDEVAAIGIDLDEPRHRPLLGTGGGVTARGR